MHREKTHFLRASGSDRDDALDSTSTTLRLVRIRPLAKMGKRAIMRVQSKAIPEIAGKHVCKKQTSWLIAGSSERGLQERAKGRQVLYRPSFPDRLVFPVWASVRTCWPRCLELTSFRRDSSGLTGRSAGLGLIGFHG